jgi:hypothetical protein
MPGVRSSSDSRERSLAGDVARSASPPACATRRGT